MNLSETDGKTTIEFDTVPTFVVAFPLEGDPIVIGNTEDVARFAATLPQHWAELLLAAISSDPRFQATS